MGYIIHPDAYYKVLLHCAKYPTRAVNGVFVGRYDKEKKKVMIEDCFPLLHLTVGLLPLLESGLVVIEELCEKQKLEVVGYYFCNERVDDEEVNKYHIAIAEKMKRNFLHSFVWMMDNKKFGKDEFCVKILRNSDYQKLEEEKGAEYDFFRGEEEVNAEELYRAINRKTKNLKGCEDIRKLVDFESHVDNVTLDFRNSDVTIQ